MEFLGFVDRIIIDKGHPVTARAIIVVVCHVTGTAQGQGAGLTFEGLGLGIGAPRQKGQRGRFRKDGGMNLERRGSPGVLGKEIDVGIAMFIP